MGAGHAHPLYVHGHSPVHRLPPEVKLVAAVAFVFAVAVTPREAVWAFGVDAAALVVVAAIAGLRPGFVLARITIVLPFLAFALLVPFVSSGQQVEVLGVGVSREGLWGAWNIVAKATLGATVSVLLAATTEIPRLLRGMTRLRVPTVLTAIAAFMVRYLEVVAGELGRMRTAMTSRGYDPRWLAQARPMADAAGALFIRSFERGERVHAAMLARGYTGTMPVLEEESTTTRDRLVAAVPPLVAATAALVATLGAS